jgi:hypothetical protein
MTDRLTLYTLWCSARGGRSEGAHIETEGRQRCGTMNDRLVLWGLLAGLLAGLAWSVL